MPASLIYQKPSNLHLPDDVVVEGVDRDLYNICARLREISKDLYIVLLKGHKVHKFAVIEDVTVPGPLYGQQSVVKMYDDLDARVIEDMKYYYSVPANERAKVIQKWLDENERQRQEAASEELYEQMGRPMWTELERCGFIQRPVSYPKLGVTSHGRRAR